MGNVKFQGVEDSSAVCGGDVEVPHDTHCHHDEEETSSFPDMEASTFWSILEWFKTPCQSLIFLWVGIHLSWLQKSLKVTGIQVDHPDSAYRARGGACPPQSMPPICVKWDKPLLEVSSSSMEHSESLGIWLAVVFYIEKTNTEWCGPPWRTDLLWALWSHRDGSWWPVVDMQRHTVNMQEPLHCSHSLLII